MVTKGEGKSVTDCKIFKAAVFSSGDLCGHGTEVHGLLDDIVVGGDQLWIYGFEEEGVIVLSTEVGQSHVVRSWAWWPKHFLICVMSLERTCLSGFSFTGRGGMFWASSKATDFRFLDIFIVERRRGWGTEKNGKDGPIIP
jgi:hypothetical protein